MKRKIVIISLIILISVLNIGCTSLISGLDEAEIESLVKDMENTFEGENLSKKIVDKSRKTDGDFNIFQPHLDSEESRIVSKAFNGNWVDVYELNNLKEGNLYNIDIYSEYYEKDNLKARVPIFSQSVKGYEKMYLMREMKVDDSKRDVVIHIAKENEILHTLEYYLPSNWNTAGMNYNVAFNNDEEIPLMMYDRGIKGANGKYKTASTNLSAKKEKRDKSIVKTMKKNEQTVILKMSISEKDEV